MPTLLVILSLVGALAVPGWALAQDAPPAQPPASPEAADAAVQGAPASSAPDKAKDKDKKKPDEQPPGAAAPPPEKLRIYEQIDVTGRASDLVGTADSATEGVTGHEDLEKRPVLRPGEVLETVPGVVITQHSGSGKANQYYARGFNLDHGTDFRITVDGIDVNMPSHGHGQGYSDINFLIPELVDSVSYRKGPYDARDGDFSAAGAADIEYLTSLPKALAELTPGTDGYGRAFAAASQKIGEGDLLGGLEISRDDGPWVNPDGYKKFNGVLRYNRGDAANGYTVSAMGYSGRWNSTDQVPRRAIDEGILSRFGTIDPSDGGDADRVSLSADFRRGSETSITRLRVFGLYSSLDLFSNFTYFLDDPV
ncbi:MAG TPA: TonB-dependent receptor, partial [Thermoanaerobaculia bacterium]